MFRRIATIALITVVATVEGERLWNNLLGRWAGSNEIGWYSMPQNMLAATSEGWTTIEGVSTSDIIVGMGYYDDPTVILLYNTNTEHVIGLQFSLLVSDIKNEGVTLDYTANPYMIEKTLNGVQYYTSTVFFSEDEVAGTREIQVLKNDGTLENIPTNTAELVSETAYEKKVCIRTMGYHYYKMNRSTTVDEWSPWAFTTEDTVNFNSIVFTGVGRLTVIKNRNWTENFAPTALATNIPSTPQWLQDLLGEFGFISFHLFLSDPRGFICPDQ